MANKGWLEEDGWHYLLDSAHRGGRYLQERHQRNAGRARRWFHRQYEDALRFVRANPPGDPMHNVAELSRLKVAAQGRDGFSTGQAGVTERAVMRVLLQRGLELESPVVRCSVRDLAVGIDGNLPTVSNALGRLEHAGWIEVHAKADVNRAATYRLTTGKSVTGSSFLLGGKDTPVTEMPVQVHPLFGSQGLGRSVAETYSVLPPDARPSGTGRLMRTNRGVPLSAKGARRVVGTLAGPTADRLHGLTAVEVRDVLMAGGGSVSIETVRRHLKKMQAASVAFRSSDGRWCRYHFDADGMAAHLGIPNTPRLKRQRYDQDRLGYLEWLTTDRGRHLRPNSIEKHFNGHDIVYRVADGRHGFRELGRREATQYEVVEYGATA